MGSLYWSLKSSVIDMGTWMLQDLTFYSLRGIWTWKKYTEVGLLAHMKVLVKAFKNNLITFPQWLHDFTSYSFPIVVSFIVAVIKCQLKNPRVRFNLAHGFRLISPPWWRAWQSSQHGKQRSGRGVLGTRHILGHGPRDLFQISSPQTMPPARDQAPAYNDLEKEHCIAKP